jgi:ketosteroid isomerase-like protein
LNIFDLKFKMRSTKTVYPYLRIVLLIWIIGCTPTSDHEKTIQELRDAEGAFALSAEKNGLAIAFFEFAAPDAVINRGGLIKGPEAIKAFYLPMDKSGVRLKWYPDYINVSNSGDLGYTYGAFTRSVPDSTGKMVTTSGIFHTVWKKQKDGIWKYVWD